MGCIKLKAQRNHILFIRLILSGYRCLLFWVLSCSTSWYISITLMYSTWISYQNNAISFMVETSYTEWDSKFPAVFVCDVKNDDKIATVSDKNLPSFHSRSHALKLQMISNRTLGPGSLQLELNGRKQVKSLNIHQRKCRFAEENYLDVINSYSYSACLMQCRKDAQLRKCGCAHHLMPNLS
ncbi:hypothetical protein D910_09425, partial [Dendroctonus ponderosae]